MSVRSIVVQGEVYLTLAAAADCFAVEVAWVEEVHALGLLGPGERVGDAIAVPARQLDRLAEVLRLHRYHGVELATLVVLLHE